MIGTIVGAAAGLANTIAGGVQTAKANKERKKLLQDEHNRIQGQYDREYYQDYLSRSDIQSLVSKLQEQSKRRSENAAGTAAVMGSTPEAVAAQKQGEAEAMGQSIGQIAGYGDQWKQGVADRYNQQMSNLRGMEYQFNAERSANLSNMLRNGAMSIAGSVSGLDGVSKHLTPVEDPENASRVKLPTEFGE